MPPSPILHLLSPAARSSRTAHHPHLLAVAGQHGGRTIMPVGPDSLDTAVALVDARAAALEVQL